MEMKIVSIQIKCKSKSVFVSFSNNIFFVYGNSGTGKTTLLNLVNYGLGNDLIKTEIVEKEVIGISLTVMINGEMVNIERKLNSNSLILMREEGSVGLYAKSKNFKQRSFSDFLYEFEGIEPIKMLRKTSGKEVKITFANYMWFSYLRQEELDSTLFYLDDVSGSFKGIASNYVLKILLGKKEISERDINKKLILLRGKQEDLKKKLSVVREIYSSTNLLDLNLSEEIVKKQKEILKIKEEVEELKEDILGGEKLFDSSLIDILMEKQRIIGIFEAEIRYLKEFIKISQIKERYIYELNQCEKRISNLEIIRKDCDDEFFLNNIRKLEKIFWGCLLDVGFSYLQPTDYVRINNNTFVPSIYSKGNKFKFSFSNLSSGGKKTIFKICYALAIHIFVEENAIQSLLPNFIIIDTPMKNISEREDDVMCKNLYGYFLNLFSKGGKLEKKQLVIIDKELPLEFQKKDIMYKHMTNEKPLIPFII